MDSFVSVYVDMAAGADAVRAAVAKLANPRGVLKVTVDDTAVSDTFGCRIAVDLTGTFDEQTEGLAIARRYAEQLSEALRIPVHALCDLLGRDYPAS
ncbi:MAG: hypothetical protein K2X52_28605 [Mycobacteriaceae bacterium]|nr:hypothetical protein [Mycobacteriaceae bacterium]